MGVCTAHTGGGRGRGEERDTELQMCVFIPHSPVAILSHPWHEERVGTDVSMVYISAHIHWASCFPIFPLAANKESVQFSSVAQSYPTLCSPMNHSTPGLPVHHQLQSLPKPMSIESVMPSNHLILCHPLLLLPSIFPSIRVFSNESVLHIRWPKYWSFSFNISPSN